MKLLLTYLTAFVLTFTLLPSSHAVLIVDYAPDGSSTSFNAFDGVGGFDANGDALDMSTGNPGFVGQPFAGESNAGSRNGFRAFGGSTRIVLVPDAADQYSLVLYRDDQFINGLNSNVGFAFGDTTTMDLVNLGAAYSNGGRMVIRVGEDYYASSTNVFNSTSLITVEPTSLTWIAYDPETDPTDFSGSVVDLVSPEFGGILDVTAVGYVFVSTGAGSTNSTNRILFGDFESNASFLVPEPTTGAAFGLAGLGLLLMRRRRQ